MSDDYLPLGPAPRPTTGEEVLTRLRALVREQGEGRASLADALAVLDRMGLDLDGDDVASLEIDATGVRLGRDALASDARAGVAAPRSLAPITARARGVLRHASVQAHPIDIAGVPVDVDARVAGLPFHWIEAADDSVGFEVVEPGAGDEVEGEATLRMPQAELVSAIREVATALGAEQGVDVRDLDVRLEQAGPRGARVDVTATVRKGFLGASVQATGAASIDDDLVLRFDDVSISSGNLIVAGLLAAVRGRVEQATARPIPLGDHVPDGIRVTDVRLEVGPTITVSATLG